MIIFQFFRLLYLTVLHLCGYFFSILGRKQQEIDVIRSEWVYKYMLRMGPLYIKIGQILATRSDLIGEEIAHRLRELQDNTIPSSSDYVRSVFSNEIDQPIESIFEQFNFQPIASASIAQVHEGILHTGQKVAVKIVKNNVKQQLKQNLEIVQIIVKIVHFMLPSVRQLNLPARFQELYILLIAQTDMKQESRCQQDIYNNFKNHPYVRIPTLIPELCTSSILVMEFIEGIKGQNAHQVELPAPLVARRFQEAIWSMLYFDGYSHGDPHPGNIIFTKDGQVVFIDFGITVNLSEDEKWGLSSFYFACNRQEWDLAVERFTKDFVVNKDNILREWSQYKQEVADVLKLHFDVRKNRWSTIAYFQDINKILKKYKAQYTTTFTKIDLLLLSFEGFLNQIDPDIDIWENVRKFIDRFSPYMNATVKEIFDNYFSQHSPHSIELRDYARNYLVAPTHIDRYFFPSTYPLFIKKANGCKLEDVDGNEYLDISCGYGPHFLGYAHPAITTALIEAVQMGGVNVMGNLPEVQLAETIVKAFSSADKVIFSNSGTESVLHAIRLCRAYRKRDRIAKFEGHFHGFSDQGMVSSWFRFTGEKDEPQPMNGTQGCNQNVVRETLVLQYGHPKSLERLRKAADQLACVICEPMSSLMATYDTEFLRELRNVCTQLGLPLIFDEVVTGFRVAYGGIQTLAGISPDLTCLGKIIGGGLPCGAVAGKAELIDIAKSSRDPFVDYESKAFIGGTMTGNSLTCSAGLAALTYLRDHPEIYTRLEQQTNWLAQELLKIAQKYNIQFKVKANRSIFSLSFTHKDIKFYREKQAGSNFKANLALAYYMRKHGVYMPELHTLMLNASHTQQDLETICQAFEQSLQEMIQDKFFVM
jgi:glutamate-1-semialdehyde 2,1-aminomutase